MNFLMFLTYLKASIDVIEFNELNIHSRLINPRSKKYFRKIKKRDVDISDKNYLYYNAKITTTSQKPEIKLIENEFAEDCFVLLKLKKYDIETDYNVLFHTAINFFIELRKNKDFNEHIKNIPNVKNNDLYKMYGKFILQYILDDEIDPNLSKTEIFIREIAKNSYNLIYRLSLHNQIKNGLKSPEVSKIWDDINDCFRLNFTPHCKESSISLFDSEKYNVLIEKLDFINTKDYTEELLKIKTTRPSNKILGLLGLSALMNNLSISNYVPEILPNTEFNSSLKYIPVTPNNLLRNITSDYFLYTSASTESHKIDIKPENTTYQIGTEYESSTVSYYEDNINIKQDNTTVSYIDNDTTLQLDNTTVSYIDDETTLQLDNTTVSYIDGEMDIKLDNSSMPNFYEEIDIKSDNTTLPTFDNTTLQTFDNTTLQTFDNTTLQTFDNTTLQTFDNETKVYSPNYETTSNSNTKDIAYTFNSEPNNRKSDDALVVITTVIVGVISGVFVGAFGIIYKQFSTLIGSIFTKLSFKGMNTVLPKKRFGYKKLASAGVLGGVAHETISHAKKSSKKDIKKRIKKVTKLLEESRKNATKPNTNYKKSTSTTQNYKDFEIQFNSKKTSKKVPKKTLKKVPEKTKTTKKSKNNTTKTTKVPSKTKNSKKRSFSLSTNIKLSFGIFGSLLLTILGIIIRCLYKKRRRNQRKKVIRNRMRENV